MSESVCANEPERQSKGGERPGCRAARGDMHPQTLPDTSEDHAMRHLPRLDYAVVLDGDIQNCDHFATLSAARAFARWLAGHPARTDRVRYGRGGQIQIARTIECEWTGETVIDDRYPVEEVV